MPSSKRSRSRSPSPGPSSKRPRSRSPSPGPSSRTRGAATKSAVKKAGPSSSTPISKSQGKGKAIEVTLSKGLGRAAQAKALGSAEAKKGKKAETSASRQEGRGSAATTSTSGQAVDLTTEAAIADQEDRQGHQDEEVDASTPEAFARAVFLSLGHHQFPGQVDFVPSALESATPAQMAAWRRVFRRELEQAGKKASEKESEDDNDASAAVKSKPASAQPREHDDKWQKPPGAKFERDSEGRHRYAACDKKPSEEAATEGENWRAATVRMVGGWLKGK